MEEKPEIGVVDRVKSYFRKKPLTPSDQVDEYITQRLPEYIDEYKLARREDLKGVDERLDNFTGEVDELKEWKDTTEGRLKEAKRKVERLEKQLGMEEEG